jgi:hypothetical protein
MRQLFSRLRLGNAASNLSATGIFEFVGASFASHSVAIEQRARICCYYELQSNLWEQLLECEAKTLLCLSSTAEEVDSARLPSERCWWATSTTVAPG